MYRIADPLLAFRMIDGDRSSLTEILRDMFVGDAADRQSAHARRVHRSGARATATEGGGRSGARRDELDRVDVTSTNGSEMFGFLSAGLDQVLAVAREKT